MQKSENDTTNKGETTSNRRYIVEIVVAFIAIIPPLLEILG